MVTINVPDQACNIQSWSYIVKLRDNFTCQNCKKKFTTDKVHAHHIDKTKDRLVISNGITLCPACHSRRHHPEKPFYTEEKLSKILKVNIKVIRELIESKIIIGKLDKETGKWKVTKENLDKYMINQGIWKGK